MITIGRTTAIATLIGSGLLLGAFVAPAEKDETTRTGQQLVIDPLVFDTTAAREDPLKVEVEVEVDVEAPKEARRGKPKKEKDKDKGEETATKEREAKDDEREAKDDEAQEEEKEGKDKERPATQASPIIVDAECCVNGICRWGPCDPRAPIHPYGGHPYGGGYDEPYYGY
jgi:hypothetical protein